ncbi:MAG: UbiA family prenyltransferase [Planctomycetaceae bacterium]|jgi:4-hydroxybenzoate polyprenyltransferase|nr:UbiA family prenyltransferase [Planctomycetaceae bacterium]
MTILQLLRISALPTILSNVLAAYLIGHGDNFVLLLFLFVSASSIYLGGMVLNDYFDADLDAIERPERPIPSGKISLQSAFILGMSLTTIGVFIGFICPFLGQGGVSEKRMAIALVTILFCCAISYNAFLKRMSIIGPVTMGACRILCYLFVFFTVEQTVLTSHVIWSLLVGTYIMCLTMVSSFEANSPKIQKWASIALSMLIPIDAVACLFFVGIIPALFVISLYPLTILLRRFVSMT